MSFSDLPPSQVVFQKLRGFSAGALVEFAPVSTLGTRRDGRRGRRRQLVGAEANNLVTHQPQGSDLNPLAVDLGF